MTKSKIEMNTSNIFIIMMIGAIVGFIIGIPIGMLTQQMILFKGIEMVAPAFDGIEVNIDLNETVIVDGLTQVAEDITNEDNRVDLGVGYYEDSTSNCTGGACR